MPFRKLQLQPTTTTPTGARPLGDTPSAGTGATTPQTLQPSAPQNQGFMTRVQSNLRRRGERFAESRAAQARGEQTPIETGLQLAGETLGTVFDTAFEGVVSAARVAVPGIDEKVKAVFDTPLGQAALNALNKGTEAYMNWRDENPRAARNIEAVFEIGATIPIAKGPQVVGKAARIAGEKIAPITTKVTEKGVEVVSEAAGKAAKAVEETLEKQRLGEALEITRVRVGELTAKQKKELLRTGKTETKVGLGGLSRKEVISVTDQDRLVAKAVSDVVSPDQGASQNIKAIREKIGTVSEEIETGLRGNNTIFNKKQLRSRLNELREDSVSIFGREKTLVNQYDDVVDFFEKIMDKHPKNNTGLLAARKEFDREFKSRFPNIFEKFDSTDSGRVAAFQNVRRQVNDIISDSLPEGNTFKAQLKEQNLMFDAVDNIALKGAKNLETGLIERSLQAIDAHGIRTLVISGSLLGIGFLTSPTVILSLLAGAATLKIGKKIFQSKAIKRGIIDALKAIQKPGSPGPKLNDAQLKDVNKTIALLQSSDDVKA